VVLYTDGLTEMMDINEIEYGEHRLIERALEYRHHPVEAICSKIIKSVKQHGSGINEIDDMTLVVIKAREDIHDAAL
jgi:serine phosphatase RsbU (regulator of sigma subunit)